MGLVRQLCLVTVSGSGQLTRHSRRIRHLLAEEQSTTLPTSLFQRQAGHLPYEPCRVPRRTSMRDCPRPSPTRQLSLPLNADPVA